MKFDAANPYFPRQPLLNSIVVPNAAAAGSINLPIDAVISGIYIRNTTANAITGGLKIGTTAGGTDVVAAQAVGANAIVHVTDATLLKRYFSNSATQKIFFDAVSAWNSASIYLYILYHVLPPG